MLTACWKTKATDIHSEYEIIIVFLPQQLQYERTSNLRFYVHLSMHRFVFCNQWRHGNDRKLELYQLKINFALEDDMHT